MHAVGDEAPVVPERERGVRRVRRRGVSRVRRARGRVAVAERTRRSGTGPQRSRRPWRRAASVRAASACRRARAAWTCPAGGPRRPPSRSSPAGTAPPSARGSSLPRAREEALLVHDRPRLPRPAHPAGQHVVAPGIASTSIARSAAPTVLRYSSGDFARSASCRSDKSVMDSRTPAASVASAGRGCAASKTDSSSAAPGRTASPRPARESELQVLVEPVVHELAADLVVVVRELREALRHDVLSAAVEASRCVFSSGSPFFSMSMVQSFAPTWPAASARTGRRARCCRCRRAGTGRSRRRSRPACRRDHDGRERRREPVVDGARA